MIRIAGAVLLFALAQGAARADTLPGSEVADFQAALDSWLQNDEETSLPAMSGLAQDGNAAAQLMLALIDKSPELQGPWLSRQPRAARISLMRDEGGLSGQSWIHSAAEVSELARHWQTLWTVDAPIELVRDFAELGEERAARVAVTVLAARERRGFADLAEYQGYPPAMRYFIWREWAGDPAHLNGLADEILSLAPGDPQRVMMGEDVSDVDYGNWLMSAPEALPIAALCEARCADSQHSCGLAAARALNDPLLVMVQGSPAEALVPAETFAQSPRGRSTLMRRVLLGASSRMRPALLAATAQIDSCFAEALVDEQARY